MVLGALHAGCYLTNTLALDESDMSDLSQQDMREGLDDGAALDQAIQDISPGADTDMAPDNGLDMSEEEVDLAPALPPGWWDGAWRSRHALNMLVSYDEEIVLPLKIPGLWSAHKGEDLHFVFDAQTEPLMHEIEVWTDEVDNVVWVRFPQGFQKDDTIWVYSGLATAPETSTDDPAGTWRGLARHVYHFDGANEVLEYDSVGEQPVHLAKAMTGGPSPYVYSIPDGKMGRHLTLNSTTIPLESQGSISPLHIPPGRDTTYEVHVSFDAFPDDTDPRKVSRAIMADENACTGNQLFYGMQTLGVRHSRGEGCVADGYPAPKQAQTINNFVRIYLDTSYLIFSRADWTTMIRQTRVNDSWSNTVLLELYTQGEELTPQRLFIGRTPFAADERSHIGIDTLIVHDRACSNKEIDLRFKASHEPEKVFERGAEERLDGTQTGQ